jgi:flagellar P-ring protein precursor FlgI
MRRNVYRLLSLLVCITSSVAARGSGSPQTVAIGDISTVEGIRDNPLLGYGLVVGLNGTGDRVQTIFTTQTLAGMLQRMGLQVSPTLMVVKNVAAVMVTATLPPFAVHGSKLDVAVSSMGDAKSLEGGMLLLTPLYGADGKVYAAAQGPLALGGYSTASGGNAKQINHPTVGRIPGGGIIERDLSIGLEGLTKVSLLLRDPEFVVAEDVASAVNDKIGTGAARVIDARRIEITIPAKLAVPALLAAVEILEVPVRKGARIAVNERTGTVVIGNEVQLGAVSILHGNLSIEIGENFTISSPAALGAQTASSEVDVRAQEAQAKSLELREGATVAQLVEGLQKIGATARDVVAILQAMKAAGALHADLEIL